MKKFVAVLIFVALCYTEIFSQKHDYVWIHGQYSPQATPPWYDFYFDFTTFPPIILIDSSIVDGFTNDNLSLADHEGKLIFYSDGCKIKNAQSLIVDNGDSLNTGATFDIYCSLVNYGYPLYQGLLALPMENNRYDLFHLRADLDFYPNCIVRDFLLTTIDMNANQGLGKVVEKNLPVLTGCFQVACANRHANGRDWWLLLGDNQQDTFYRFLVTPDSLEGPWIQAIENPSIDSFFFCGWSRFSPDGSRFAINSCRTGVAVYDFDRCTGLLSNLRFAPRTNWDYTTGVAFSPNSQYLYVDSGFGHYLEQFDLNGPDLESSKITVAEWDGFSTEFGNSIFAWSQHGPDGKIYLSAGDANYAHIIEYPDRAGTACKVVQRAIEFPTRGAMSGIYFPNYRLGPLDNSSCDTLGLDNLPVALFRYELADTADPLTVQFTDLSWYEPTSWSWTFGDGAMSQDSSPLHTFPWPGVYTVCLIAGNAYAADTLCQQVEVGEVSGVHELPVLPRVAVGPNPCSDALRIRLSARVAATPRFVLYDALGRLCASVALQDFETELSMEHLPGGMYFWEMQFGGRAVQVGRVVKLVP